MRAVVVLFALVAVAWAQDYCSGGAQCLCAHSDADSDSCAGKACALEHGDDAKPLRSFCPEDDWHPSDDFGDNWRQVDKNTIIGMGDSWHCTGVGAFSVANAGLDVSLPTYCLADPTKFSDATPPKVSRPAGYTIPMVTDDVSKKQVFEIKGPKSWWWAPCGKVRIDPTRNYKFSGYFRSVGTVPSRMYYGAVPFDDCGDWIDVYEAHYYDGTDIKLKSFSSTVLYTETTIDTTKWNNAFDGSSKDKNYFKGIGFYFDGDGTHLPDYVHRPSWGYYTKLSGNQITIFGELPKWVQDAIIPGTTLLRNHHATGWYLYNPLAYTAIPTTWTYYEGFITTEAFNFAKKGYKVWPINTKYAEFLMLANYRNTATSTIRFRDLKVEEVSPTLNNVQLVGSCSEHHLNWKLDYQWGQTAGAPVSFVPDNTAQNPRVNLASAQTYTFTLQVRSKGNATDPWSPIDSVTIKT